MMALVGLVAAVVSQFVTVQLPTIVSPPDPMFSRTIYAQTSIQGVQVMLDACHGPIAVPLGPNRPVLVAEHDYCGGSDWIPKLSRGDAVALVGEGAPAQLFVVEEIRYQIRREAQVRDLPASDVVLQTCVTPTKVVLVGLKRFSTLRY